MITRLRQLFQRIPDADQIDPGTPQGLRDALRLLDSNHAHPLCEHLNQIKARRVPVRNTDYLRGLHFKRRGQVVAAIEAFKEELRYFPDNQDAHAALQEVLPKAPAVEATGDSEFDELHRQIQSHTMVGPKRLASLYRQAKILCQQDLPGNFVECGVAAGGTSVLLACVIARHSKRPRHLYACDTFEGMPPAGQEDVHEGVNAEATGWGTGTCAAPAESLLALAKQLDVRHLITPVQGLFADTLPAHRAGFGPIAFLHVDGDWYASTRDILVNLYDQITPGGGIQIDDFGYWEGCRKAWSEFEAEHGLSHQLESIDETGVFTSKAPRAG